MTCIDSLLRNKEYAREIPLIKTMRSEGKTDRQIYDFLETREKQHKKEMMKFEREIKLTKNNKGEIVPMANCSGDSLGVESGTFGAWLSQTRCWSSVISNCTPTPWVNAALPITNRISTSSIAPNDPCGDLPGKPIQLPSPYGGNHSIRLGNNDIDAGSERLSYTFTVQADDANFVYQYAAVLEDPGHLPSNQPYFDFVILDQNGDTIPCSFQHYTAGPGLPGFNVSNKSNSACASFSGGFSDVYYSPWTLVGVNLGSYIGQSVTVICTTADCSQCGHFGYTYLDFSCGAISKAQYCIGEDSVLLSAPADASFSYSWSSGETTNSVIANPQTTQTVTVHITQNSSTCGFDLVFLLTPTVMNPALSYSVDCSTGYLNVTDSSTVTSGTLNGWNWQFPGGSPSSSTSQNPGLISYPPGAYIISLTVTSQAGCTKSMSQPIDVGLVPTAQFGYAKHISCEGTNVDFTSTSLNTSSWDWNFGDGGASSEQNPTYSYPRNGTYSVTLIAINPPCRDTLTYPLVVASILDTLTPANIFTPNGDGLNDCFKPIFMGNYGDTLLECIEMVIYDRWGIEIYESQGGLVCWDGRTKTNTKAKDGTYYYLIKFGESTYKGYVTLLRESK